MASQSNATDADRPAARSRMQSGLENILPASIAKRSECIAKKGESGSKSRHVRPQPTPLMDRSISSMTDSFMLEHWGSSSSTSFRSPQPEAAESGTTVVEHAPVHDDGLTPISNWAHLTYIKTQRNNLRSQLKAEQLAGAEVKRSVTSLRRLAFRMAVNISVKEKQIATSARNLANSRKGSYLQGKDAEQRIEALRRALRVEECRNAEILGALEKASMLTLEYSTPRPEARQRQLFSPPPSPPTRNANLPDSPLTSPRTPTRPSPWHDFDLGLTPNIESPRDIRTSDSRLIRAKRESDQALAACRNRIEALQNECVRTREDADLLETSKIGLEQEIRSHQTRIANLERSRAAVEEALQLAQKQLQTAAESEENLKRQLDSQNADIANLQGRSQESDDAINTLQNEKNDLEHQLYQRNTELQHFETRLTEMTNNMNSLQLRLDNAEHQEISLRDQLAEKEQTREDVGKRLDRGTKYIVLLEQKVTTYESEIEVHKQKIQAHHTDASALHDQLKELEEQKSNTDAALVAMRTDVSSLQSQVQNDQEELKKLRTDLQLSHETKDSIAEELRVTRDSLATEGSVKDQLQADLTALTTLHERVQSELQAAEDRIWTLEGLNDEAQTKLESLRDGKAALEADLKDARQTVFQLRDKVKMGASELTGVEATKNELEKALHESKSKIASLETELTAVRDAESANGQKHAAEIQERNAQLLELEGTVLELRTALASSNDMKESLEQRLAEAQESKNRTEQQLSDARDAQIALKGELANLQPKLASTTQDYENLQSESNRLAIDLERSRKAELELGERLDALTQESKSLKDTISGLENGLNDSQTAKAGVEQHLAEAQNDAESSRAEIAGLREHLQDTEKAKEDTETKLHEAIESRSQLQSQHELSLSRLAVLENEVAETQLQLARTQEEVRTLEQSKKEAQACTDTTKQSHRELEQRFKVLESRLKDADERAKELQSSLSMNEEELETLYRDKHVLKSRVAQISERNAGLQVELELAQDNAKAVENRFNDLGKSRTSLQSELESASTMQKEMQEKKRELELEVTKAQGETESLRLLKSSLEKKLAGALATVADLADDVSVSNARVQEAESQRTVLVNKLSDADANLLTVQSNVANLEERLRSAEETNDSLEANSQHLRLQLEQIQTDRDTLATQVTASEDKVAQAKNMHTGLEGKLQASLQRAEELESALNKANMEVDIARQETSTVRRDLQIITTESNSLREANAKLKTSEKDVLVRLASAEEELNKVRETNARLEAFLGRVELDMFAAEAAVTASEKRLEEFVEQSQSEMEAAKLDKLKYKRELLARNNELKILIDENAALQHQVGERTAELGGLREGKDKLAQDLSDKDRYITELSSSSEKRLKSMHTAYNELSRKHSDLQTASRAMAAQYPQVTTTEHDLSTAELEQKVRDLEDDKKALRRLVQTLKEKVRGLEVLKEWQEGHEVDEPTSASPRRVTILDYSSHSAASSPRTQHTKSPRPDSLHSQPTSVGQLSTTDERPTTRHSHMSDDEDLGAWAKEVERVRMLRDETVVQLRDLKKSQHTLKKSLKDTEAQLHRLEKQQSPKHHRALLRKSRPSTPFGMFIDSDHEHAGTQSPPRPATSAGLHHTADPQTSRVVTNLVTAGAIPRANTSSPRGHNRRWSMMPRPTTPEPAMIETNASQRPTTSHSFMNKLNHRPTSSSGDDVLERPKEKRRWSSGLRTFFRADS